MSISDLRSRIGVRWLGDGRVAYLPQNPAALLHRETVRAEIEWTSRRALRAAGGAPSTDLLDALGADVRRGIRLDQGKRRS